MTEGGWSLYPGGKLDISVSVKAYFALKLAGHDPEAEHMQRARIAIRAAGGADAVNSFTRFFLALLGQISYAYCPAVPPEIDAFAEVVSGQFVLRECLDPHDTGAAVDHFGTAAGRRARSGAGHPRAFLARAESWPPLRCPGLKGGTGPLSWDRFFRLTDAWLHFCQRRRCCRCGAGRWPRPNDG